jgi:hypothetical protein
LHGIRKLPANLQDAYRAIAEDARYAHFVRIPLRLIKCIDYFGITCHRTVARDRLLSFYLFIGVVDQVLDSAQIEIGQVILGFFENRAPGFTEALDGGDVRLVTEVLKSNISEESYQLIKTKLGRLYGRVLRERAAESMAEHIRCRQAVGALTADVSYLLIEPCFERTNKSLLRFMKRVGAVGCLIDSLIDLGSDRSLGLLRFTPAIKDYRQLIQRLVALGLRLLFDHPHLSPLFLQAAKDDFLDRFGRRRHLNAETSVADRKEAIARVV